MANICSNFIEIFGEPEYIAELYQKIKTSGELLNVLCPVEDYPHIPVSDLISIWGTKGDVDVEEIHLKEISDSKSVILGGFETKWSPPIGAVEAFIQRNSNPGFEVNISYFEPGSGICGMVKSDGTDLDFDVSDMTVEEMAEVIPEELEEIMGVIEYFTEFEAEFGTETRLSGGYETCRFGTLL